MLKGPDNTLALEKWRHDISQQVRHHLSEHVDEALRPRDRNDSHALRSYNNIIDMHNQLLNILWRILISPDPFEF